MHKAESLMNRMCALFLCSHEIKADRCFKRVVLNCVEMERTQGRCFATLTVVERRKDAKAQGTETPVLCTSACHRPPRAA